MAVALKDGIPNTEIESTMRIQRIPEAQQLQVLDDVLLMQDEAKKHLNRKPAQ